MSINKWDETSISMTSGFSVLGKKPNFSRDLFENLEQMVACPAMYLPDAFHAQIVAPFMDPMDPTIELYSAGQTFDFVRDRDDDPILGKWRPLGGGGGAIDDSSRTRNDASWSCRKLFGLIGDFDNVDMNAFHDRLSPDYNWTSSPIEVEYDPPNPLYKHGISDPLSANYDTQSPDYEPVSDPENVEGNERRDGYMAEAPYYNPLSALYNPIVDNNALEYDPDNPNYDGTKDSSNKAGQTRADGNPAVAPYYIEGSNEKYIEVWDRVDDITEAAELLNRESISRVLVVPYTNSEGKGSGMGNNLLFEDREGRRVAILYNVGLNPDIVKDYKEADPETGEEVVDTYTYEQARQLPQVGHTHTLDTHADVEDDFFDNYEDFKKWVGASNTGDFSELTPYVWSGSTVNLEALYDDLIDSIEAAGYDISEPLLGYRAEIDGPIVPYDSEEPFFYHTGEFIWLVLGHYETEDNPDYSAVSDPTNPDYDIHDPAYVSYKDSSNIKGEKRADPDETDAEPPYYIEGSNEPTIEVLHGQFPKIQYSAEDSPEGRWVNTYVRPDSMVLRWSDKAGKWLIQKDSLEAAKEYTDKQIRLAINGQAYVTQTEPVFHSATLDPVTGEVIEEGFVEYTEMYEGELITKIGVPEARYYWTTEDPISGEDKTLVYLWMDETGRQQVDEGNWLILDAADVNFTQFWSKQVDTIDDYWWRDESRVRHTHQDDSVEDKKSTILSLYGTEKAIEDWTIDSVAEDKAKDKKDHPLSANQGYLLDQKKEERFQFDNVDGVYDLRVPEACEALAGKVIWYYGPTKYASVSWDHVPNGVYTNIHDFQEYFWNWIYHTYPNLNNIEIKKSYGGTDDPINPDIYVVQDRDGVLTKVAWPYATPGDVTWRLPSAGGFANAINMGISTESVWETLEFHNKIQIEYDDPTFDPEYPPEDWDPEDGWPRLTADISIVLYRTLLEDMETENFYRCVSGLDEDDNEIWYWSKVDMGGDAYQTRYVSSYCQEAQPSADFIDGTRNINNVGTALDKIYYELWGVETKIKKFQLTYGYEDPDGNIKEGTHDFRLGDLALQPGQTILNDYTIDGVAKKSKLTWLYSKPLASEAPSSTDVVEQQFLWVDGGQRIVGNNKYYEIPDGMTWGIGTTFKLRGVDAGGLSVEASFAIGQGGVLYYGDLPHNLVYDYNTKAIEFSDVWEHILTQNKEYKVQKAGVYTPNAERGHSFFAYPASWGDITTTATYPLLKESGKQSAFWDIHTLDYYEPSDPTPVVIQNEYGVNVEYLVAYSTQTRHGKHFTWVIDVPLVTDTITGEIYENEFVKQNQGPANEGKFLSVDETGNVICQDLSNIECNVKKLTIMPAPDGSWEGQLVEYIGGTYGDYEHNSLYVCDYNAFTSEYEWRLVSGAGGITQVDEMPTIVPEEENNIYQYIGPFTSTPEGGTFKHNSIYICDKNSDTDELYWKEIGSGGFEQYEELPAAIATLKDKVVQYIGPTMNDPVTGHRWVHSNVYVCDVLDDTVDPPTYEWRDISNNRHLNAIDVEGLTLPAGVTGYVKTVGNIVFFSLTHEGTNSIRDIAQFMPKPFGDVFFVPKFQTYEVGDDFRVELLDGDSTLKFSDGVYVKNFTVSGSYISEDLEPVGVLEGTNPEYVRRNQGVEYRGKFLQVNESGLVVPTETYSMRPKNVHIDMDSYTTGSCYTVGPIVYVEISRRSTSYKTNVLAEGLPAPFKEITVPIKSDNAVLYGTLSTSGVLSVDVEDIHGETGVYNMDVNFSYPNSLEFDCPMATSANYVLRSDLTTDIREIVEEIVGEILEEKMMTVLRDAGILTDIIP